MKNILCFAVCGNDVPAVPQGSSLAFGGFGFAPDGTLRAPCSLPRDAVVLFDDRTLPEWARPELLREFLCDQGVKTVIFDFERAKTEVLCELIRSVHEVQTVVPPAYAALCHGAIFVPSYHPREPFAQYLQRWQKKKRTLFLDLSPVGSELFAGRWTQSRQKPQSGCFTAKNQCMYSTERRQGGMAFRFFDTKKTLRGRAAASALPCIVPFSEYAALEDE